MDNTMSMKELGRFTAFHRTPLEDAEEGRLANTSRQAKQPGISRRFCDATVVRGVGHLLLCLGHGEGHSDFGGRWAENGAKCNSNLTRASVPTPMSVHLAGTSIRDQDGTGVAWAVNEAWAAVIVAPLNKAEVSFSPALLDG